MVDSIFQRKAKLENKIDAELLVPVSPQICDDDGSLTNAVT